MKVGLFGQSLDGPKFDVFRALTEVLAQYDVDWVFGPEVLHQDVGFPIDRMEKSYDYMKTVDFVFTLGGDGTILQAITLIGEQATPIVGINLGRLGFLASLDIEDMESAVQALLKGSYEIGERSMIELKSNRSLFQNAPFALNDFTLHKRDTSSMITINTFVDGEFLTAYWADGLILSTPTGSTGYSLSCGGPIIMPNSGNIVITPVAPHNLNVRPIILSDESEVSFEIEGRSDAFMCSMDSRFEVVTKAHQLAIKKCSFNAKLVHVPNYSYLNNIRKKLAWGVDVRN